MYEWHLDKNRANFSGNPQNIYLYISKGLEIARMLANQRDSKVHE